MSGLGLEGGAGEVESVSIAERLKLTDNIHVMDVPGGGISCYVEYMERLRGMTSFLPV